MTRKFMQIKLINGSFFPIAMGSRKELILKLMMRTFIFLFCATLLGLTPKSAISQNDKIVIDADKLISVNAVFKMIKAQTNYSFVYHEDLFKGLPNVQLKKGSIWLNRLLNKSLSVGDINVIFTANNTILIKEITSKIQQHKVTGTVKDENNLPVPGITVLIKGTNKGTATDIDGHYTITVPDLANVLVFSSLGFEAKEIMVGNQTTINITLKESISVLKEVTINAGYYNTTQREATGSISRIEAKDIEKQPINNLLVALQGNISGVDVIQNTGLPGGNFRVQIRGVNFLLNDTKGNNDSDPLYIVDGVPFNTSVLDGFISTLITTRGVNPLNTIDPANIKSIEVLKDADATAIYGARGGNGVVLITTKKGKAGKTKVRFNVSTTLGHVANFPDLLNTEQYLQMRLEAITNDGYTLETILDDFTNFDDVNPDLYVWDQDRYTNWQKALSGGTAYRQNAQLSFSGGSKQTQFLLSGSHATQTTVFPGDSKYSSASVMFNINHQSKNGRFKIQASTNYGGDTNTLPGRDLTPTLRRLPPNAPALYDEQGNLNWENSTWQNPLAILESDYNAETRSLVTNIVLSYRPLPSLEFKANMGYTDYRTDSYVTDPMAANDPNTLEGQDSQFSSISISEGNRQSWIIEPQINWQADWGNAHLKILAGTTFQQDKQENLFLIGENFPSDDLLLNINEAKTITISDDSESEYKFHSVFGRINFNWKDKYIVNLTGRRDGSSRFGPGRQFGNFGAIGVAWVFSEEDFMERSSFLSFGKLRGSYGISGSDTSPDYAFLDTYSLSSNVVYNGLGLNPTRLFNPILAWGETKKLEAAIELGFLKDRVFITGAWYRNRSSNQLLQQTLPTTTGFNNLFINFSAIVENTGIELELRTLNIQNDHFKWSTNFNISVNRNKLVSFPGLESSSFSSRYVVGESLNILRLYDFVGVNPETGIAQFKDFNNDGLINFDDRTLEDLAPKFTGGLRNNLQYKNWELGVFFQFKKQKRTNYLQSTFDPGKSSLNMPVMVLNRWQQVGDERLNQRYSVANADASNAGVLLRNSNAIITDASFIRLQSVLLNYRIPKTIAKELDLNVYLQGQNLFVITPYDGADPEVASFESLPLLRQFTLGLNVSF